jgi:hypothetical protein
VIILANTHDWLDLPSNVPTSNHAFWEKVPELQSTYDSALVRIRLLAEKGLTSLMVLADFLSRRIAPFNNALVLPGRTPGRATPPG